MADSTPRIIRDVEYACLRLVQEHLDEGESSVGIQVRIDLLAATPVGHWVEIGALSIEGRRITMTAVVLGALEEVRRGEHGRFAIDVARYARRRREKRERQSATRAGL